MARRVSRGEHLWGLPASQIELLNRVETSGRLDLTEAVCPIEEVRGLIGAGLLCLEVRSFPWGIDFSIVPTMASASGANAWKEVSE